MPRPCSSKPSRHGTMKAKKKKEKQQQQQRIKERELTNKYKCTGWPS